MPVEVQGKRAIITGAGSGIGLSFTRLLLSKGCSVMLADINAGPDVDAVLKEFPHPSSDGKAAAQFQKTDVTSWKQLTALWKSTIDAFGGVDIVIPAAGLFEPSWSSFWRPPKTDTNPDSESRDPADGEPGHYATLDVNLTQPIRLTQMAIGYWTQNNMQGHVLHMASVAGYLASMSSPLYNTSKAALIAFVRTLSALKEELGIRISAVCPGPASTNLWKADPNRAHLVTDEKKHWMTAEDVCDAMFELLTGDEYGNGSVMEVTNKGRRMVPLYGLEAPTMDSVTVPGISEMREKLREKLKTEGLKV